MPDEQDLPIPAPEVDGGPHGGFAPAHCIESTPEPEAPTSDTPAEGGE